MRWLALVVLCAPAVAVARTASESEALVRDQIVPKLDLMCGTHLTVRYDAASLATSDVEDTCEEPLRYLYYACQNGETRRAIEAEHLVRFECRGGAAESMLTVERGKISLRIDPRKVDMGKRLDELGTALGQKGNELWTAMDGKRVWQNRDPKWDAFIAAPLPAATSTDYCIIDGKKGPLPPTGDPLAPPRSTVQCVHGGKVVSQMSADGTGFVTRLDGNTTRLDSYKNGFPDGEAWVREKGVVTKRAMYDTGRRVWESTFDKAGKLTTHVSFASTPSSTIQFDKNENVTQLDCGDGVASDPVLRSWCGFDKPRKVFIKESGNERTVMMTKGLARIVE